MKTFYLVLALAFLGSLSCTKEKKYARQIKGKYKIETYELVLNNIQGCFDTPEGVSFSVDNPGNIVFTGKKALDGPAVAQTERPYYGYFDYEFQTTDIFGNQLKAEDRSYFSYYVYDTSIGSLDTLSARIFIDGYEWDMALITEGNKVTGISYWTLSGCYKLTYYHHVK